MAPPTMKLKLNTSSNKPPNGQPSASTAAPPSSTPGTAPLKLNFGASTPAHSTPPATISIDGQTKSGKQASKKRQREDDGQPFPPKKRQSSSGVIKLPGLKTPSAVTPKTPGSGIPFFKIHTNKKVRGPHRPPGVGYDSEAEDAEDDPAIEENVMLRMQPGDDCNYLREVISKGQLGKPTQQGGVSDVFMRFFKNRRAALFIRTSIYAAVLVDLPCIIESMKSWDKRGWWKSADICQMLLVTQKVESEQEAESVPMPPEVDEKTSQYPHGLTPPMHYVRKRRFRKRVHHTTVEQAEDKVEQLLARDAEAIRAAGKTDFTIIDNDQMQSQGVSSAGEDEDAEGEPDFEDEAGALADGYQFPTMNGQDLGGDQVVEEEEEEEDDAVSEEFLAQMEAKMLEDDEDPATDEGQVTLVAKADTATQLAAATNSMSQSSAPVNGPEAESDEDDDDDDDDDDAAPKEEDLEQAHLRAQQREEIADLQRDIEKVQNDLLHAGAPIIRGKYEKRLAGLREELASKKRSLGEDPDDD